MAQGLIFAPMGVLAFLTFGVLTLIPIRRFRAGAAGQIVADDFKFGESTSVPGHVSIPNRNYMNLLELPMLFYVGSLMFFVVGKVDAAVLSLAWVYVALKGERLRQAFGRHMDPRQTQHRFEGGVIDDLKPHVGPAVMTIGFCGLNRLGAVRSHIQLILPVHFDDRDVVPTQRGEKRGVSGHAQHGEDAFVDPKRRAAPMQIFVGLRKSQRQAA